MKLKIYLSSTASPSFPSPFVWIFSCPIQGVATLQAVHDLVMSAHHILSFLFPNLQRCMEIFANPTSFHLRDIGLAKWKPSQLPHQINSWAVRVYLLGQVFNNPFHFVLFKLKHDGSRMQWQSPGPDLGKHNLQCLWYPPHHSIPLEGQGEFMYI